MFEPQHPSTQHTDNTYSLSMPVNPHPTTRQEGGGPSRGLEMMDTWGSREVQFQGLRTCLLPFFLLYIYICSLLLSNKSRNYTTGLFTDQRGRGESKEILSQIRVWKLKIVGRGNWDLFEMNLRWSVIGSWGRGRVLVLVLLA